MHEFYRSLGEKKAKKVRLAVMDMWKAFYNSTTRNAPQAAILYDKFHVMKHLGEALDKTRKAENVDRPISGPLRRCCQDNSILLSTYNVREPLRVSAGIPSES
jgi:hypothetical protein